MEMILRHSTTALCAWVAGGWTGAVACRYEHFLAGGAPVRWMTLWRAAHKSRAFVWMPGAPIMAVLALWVSWEGIGLVDGLLLVSACWILLLMAFIDARTGYLPDALTLPFILLGLAYAWVSQEGEHVLFWIAWGLLAGLALPLSSMLVYRWWRGCYGLGWGDVKLLAGMGVWLGAQGMASALLLACGAGVLAACVRAGGLRLQSAYPFGPYLAGATMFWLVADEKAALSVTMFCWITTCSPGP